jgi:hypothetical protein
VLLVGPTGAKAIVMSDVGGKSAVTNAQLIISDAAATLLPDQERLSSGTFKPVNIGSRDVFPTPAPTRPYDANLSAFNDLPANGEWQLFVYDDGRGHGGWIQSWSLEIITGPTDNTEPPISPSRLEDPFLVRMLGTDENQCRVLEIEGLSSQKYSVEASNDLETWTAIGTVTLETSVGEFVDCDALGHARRFYRVLENN